jgi:hypothetical protein
MSHLIGICKQPLTVYLEAFLKTSASMTTRNSNLTKYIRAAQAMEMLAFKSVPEYTTLDFLPFSG